MERTVASEDKLIWLISKFDGFFDRRDWEIFVRENNWILHDTSVLCLCN